MAKHENPDPVVIVIFGAGGDLTQRKLLPALYNLYLDKWLPEHFAIVGVDMKGMDEDSFCAHIRKGIDTFSRQGKTDDETWQSFSQHLTYVAGDFTEAKTYSDVSGVLASHRKVWNNHVHQVFYLAIPPSLIEPIAQNLSQAKLMHDHLHNRIVVEKPFGRDQESAHELNTILNRLFNEAQIYRIDHYLGKETVQNILAFRFANSLFEPIWDRHFVDHVQITVSERVGIGHRGGYYDHAGALRDMIQNHLLQLLCLVAMDPPVSFEDNEIRNKKVDVLHAIRPISPDQVHQVAVRGQYDTGWVQGEHVPAYNSESDVAPDSHTETFAALKLFIDNWRWQGVPFYLRTGKRLPARASQVAITFRPAPNQPFPATSVENWQPNRLFINIQPEESILVGFQAKRPGPTMHLSPVDMHFCYNEAFKMASPEAYETLLLDVIVGDATLFMRADQVEAAWSLIMPILDVWESVPPSDFPNYSAGTWGPEAASTLIARDGRSWVIPHPVPQDQSDESTET
jgi:glucose-6-phosphate 1-dehydrogenase